MFKVLFVCTGNTCRSPMAQALLTKLEKEQGATKEFMVMSAGLFTSDGLHASEEAIQVMQEYGIDLSQHKSRQLNEEVMKQADLILTMTEAHRIAIIDMFPDYEELVHTLTQYVNYTGDIADPYGRGLETYYETAAQLKELIEQLLRR